MSKETSQKRKCQNRIYSSGSRGQALKTQAALPSPINTLPMEAGDTKATKARRCTAKRRHAEGGALLHTSVCLLIELMLVALSEVQQCHKRSLQGPHKASLPGWIARHVDSQRKLGHMTLSTQMMSDYATCHCLDLIPTATNH